MKPRNAAPTRHRISTLPEQLQKGDVVRDWGVDRVVARTESDENTLRDVVLIHFDEDPRNPNLPNSLGVDRTVEMTAWREG